MGARRDRERRRVTVTVRRLVQHLNIYNSINRRENINLFVHVNWMSAHARATFCHLQCRCSQQMKYKWFFDADKMWQLKDFNIILLLNRNFVVCHIGYASPPLWCDVMWSSVCAPTVCMCVCVYCEAEGQPEADQSWCWAAKCEKTDDYPQHLQFILFSSFFFLLETKRCKTTRTSRLINSKKHGTFIMAAIKRIYEMLNDKQACMLHATGGRTDGRGRVDAQCVMCCVSAQYSVSALVTFF